MPELSGWLLDLYEDAADGLTLWLLADDGRRLRLAQPFPVTFYAAGTAEEMRRLWRWLEAQPEAPKLSRDERRDLFLPEPQTVLAVACASPHQQAALFRNTLRAFPDLTYYDADVQTALRHAARHNTFPLCHLKLETDAGMIGAGLAGGGFSLGTRPARRAAAQYHPAARRPPRSTPARRPCCCRRATTPGGWGWIPRARC